MSYFREVSAMYVLLRHTLKAKGGVEVNAPDGKYGLRRKITF
jgi:hypothetical protein